MNLEEIAFSIIVHAGGARSLCFDALKRAHEGKLSEAEELIGKAKEELTKAHHIQTGMLHKEAGGEKQEVSLLMVHAQDHLMCAILAKDMAEQMLEMYHVQVKLQEALSK